LIISLGYQDYLGVIVRINVEDLLKSMEPVIYCEENEQNLHQGRHPDLTERYCANKK